MKFENKGKWMSQIAESTELDSPENEEMALDMSEDEDIETQDEIEKEDKKDIEEISEEDEDTEDLIEDDLDLVKNEEIIDESSQKNESLDERAIKDYLNKEHSRALKNIKNMSADDSDSFYKGYATAIHELQRKFNL